MPGPPPHLLVDSDRRRSVHAWQDRIRDPSLTVLLVLEVCVLFFASLSASICEGFWTTAHCGSARAFWA